MIDYAYLDALQVHGGGVIKVTRFPFGSPAPRAVAEPRPGEHGATDSTELYGPRVWEVTGNIEAASSDAMWAALDELKANLQLGAWRVLRFRRAGLTFDEQARVRVDSPVDATGGTRAAPFITWGVSLFAPDPRVYAATVSSGDYDPTDTGSGGLSFPLVFPLVFGAGGAAALQVENEGTIATPAVLTVTGPVVNPTLDNDTVGASIRTTGLELDVGEVAVFDTDSRTLVVNGNPRGDLVDVALTDWWHLARGVNQLRLRGGGMSAGQTELAVTYRSARI